MLTVLAEATEVIQRFRTNPWPFQQSFKTPPEDLNRFVSTALSSYSPDRGVLNTDEVVFEPREVLKLLDKHSIGIENRYRFTIQAEGRHHIAELLQSALADWIDFLFVPIPELFAIYADHDEFTTFFGPSDAALKDIVSRLTNAGFEMIQNYTRRCSGNKWR